MPIDSLGPAGLYTPPAKSLLDTPIEASNQTGGSFAETLGQVVGETNRDLIDATQQAVALVTRGEGTIHDTMIAIDNAEGSFRLLMEMRNRIVEGVNRLLETQL